MKKLFLLVFYVFSLSTFGQTTVTWTGGGGTNTKWTFGSNWDSGSAPVAGDTVIIANSGRPIIDNSMTSLPTYATITIRNGCTLTLNTTATSPTAYILQATGQISVQAGGTINISNAYPTIKANNFYIKGEINNNGTIESKTNSAIKDGGKLTNNGTVICNDGTDYKFLQNEGELVSGDGSIYDCNFKNISTTLLKIDSNRTVTFNQFFNNGDVDNGTIIIGTISIKGTLIARGGAFTNKVSSTLTIDGNIDLGAKTLYNYGTVAFENGAEIVGNITNKSNLANSFSFPNGGGCTIKGSFSNDGGKLIEIPAGESTTITLTKFLNNKGVFRIKAGASIKIINKVLSNNTGKLVLEN
jgi:fibronectin-binding autotransporter adhesin